MSGAETEMLATPHRYADSGNEVRGRACRRTSKPRSLQVVRDGRALVTPGGPLARPGIVTAAAELPCLLPLRGKHKPAYTLTPGPLDTPCWLWNGCLNSRGYAVRGTHDRRYLVHRQVLSETGTPLAPGEQAHHLCETRRCVNPAHLVARTPLAHAREHAGNLTATERALRVLQDGPLTVHALAERLGLNFDSLRIALYRARLRGEVVSLGGGRYALPAMEVSRAA